jgi:hypothetical protein
MRGVSALSNGKPPIMKPVTSPAEFTGGELSFRNQRMVSQAERKEGSTDATFESGAGHLKEVTTYVDASVRVRGSFGRSCDRSWLHRAST